MKMLVLSPNTKRVCESCGARARIRLADGSAWCSSCDDIAIKLGYDKPILTRVTGRKPEGSTDGG